ncbi:lipopolysaccharide biosynthesis protein [Photobacterium leiognathi]|uniref:lipopolysaccharide biosynthesis protein n=1 Tax=Photobacterium leiognathi TaxID=553611 RepID=UPI003D9FD089
MNIKSFLSKGVANIISGFSGSLLSLVTVPIITKSLLNDELSIWFICLQISGFMIMLSFGAKLIFTRHVSQYPENKKRINKILSTCRTILNRMCILGSIATILIVIFLPYLYEIPKEILLQARFSLLIITSAMILMSWVSDLHGVLWGSNKNEKSASIILATRFLQIIAIYVCSKISPSLEFFSIAYSLPIILSSLFLVFYIRRENVIFDKFKYTKTLTQDNNVKSEMYHIRAMVCCNNACTRY